MKTELSLFERALAAISAAARRYAVPIASALAVGFAAHMYAFSNKLINADETAALFSKGATVTSGRWGLELAKLIFPDVSMPWIYGVISLLLLSAAACLIISSFQLKGAVFQALFAAAFVAFPAVTANFCYMFTSSSYALAILLASAAVYLFSLGGRRGLAGALLLSLSLGIYQAYIGLAASLCVLLLIRLLAFSGGSARECLRRGVEYFLWLILALGIYYAVTLITEALLASGYQEYEVTSGGGMIRRVFTAYSAFVGIFLGENFGYVNSGLSMAAHFVCVGLIICALVISLHRQKDARKTILLIALIVIYPLAVNCMYLIASVDIIHSLVIFGFCSFYILAAAAAEWLSASRILRPLGALALAVIAACNVFFANKVYLKMQLEYENAYSFYSTLMTQILETPGMEMYTVIDIVGNTDTGITVFDELDTHGFTGPNDDLVNTYTRASFIKYYLGLDLNLYREDVIHDFPQYDEMPCYPAEGSIVYQPQEGRIIVKLG